MAPYHVVVGTFNTPHIYTLAFEAPSSLKIVQRSEAVGSHSWLHVSNSKRNLYATAWTEPPSIVAYAIDSPTKIRKIGLVPTASRSGYVTASDRALYSAGGASGEVFALDEETGGFAAHCQSNKPLQTLNFLDDSVQQDNGSIMDFGGLRHGAHSADLSPDGKALYVADIGRNCIWTYAVDQSTGKLTLGEKHISPRSHDGPRHVWPHPSGKHVYCLQEHSSMVDVFETSEKGTKLKHVQSVRIIPEDSKEEDFWADEVRTSFSNGDTPKYLYASTRGLKPSQKGYVAVFKLNKDGLIDDDHVNGNGHIEHQASKPYTNGYKTHTGGLLQMWETPTSGGWANAVQPGPTVDGVEYLALTDSEEGLVMILAWDGKRLVEAARVTLYDQGEGAATAVWL